MRSFAIPYSNSIRNDSSTTGTSNTKHSALPIDQSDLPLHPSILPSHSSLSSFSPNSSFPSFPIDPRSSRRLHPASLAQRATQLLKHPSRIPSAFSLNSSYSNASHEGSTTSNNSDSFVPKNTDAFPAIHPYAAMVAAPVPVVSSHDPLEEEDDCPVCLEPLSFSFRLPGEKPHIVPECGHALHEVSFLTSAFSR